MATLPELLQQMVSMQGSDLHLTTNAPPTVRVHGKLTRLDQPVLGPADTKQLGLDPRPIGEDLSDSPAIAIARILGGGDRHRSVAQDLGECVTRNRCCCIRRRFASGAECENAGQPDFFTLGGRERGAIHNTGEVNHARTVQRTFRRLGYSPACG